MTKNKLNFNNTRIFLLSSLIIIIFIGSYIYTFKEFSSESSDWANFATFISLAIAIINLIIFYLLTLEIHKYNITQNKKNIKPIISFKLINSKESYWLENIGSGIAVDVKIKRNFRDNKWEEGYNYFTLSPGERVYLSWSKHSIQLVAEYKDSEGYQYYSYMDANHLRFFDKENGEKNYLTEFSKITKPIIGKYQNPS
jgi:hypothetical protein